MEPDQPILTSNEDRFGRKHFAHRIAEIVSTRDSRSGIVIGIHAPWGEGKTSVLNLIEEKLKENEEVLVIRFNPWRFAEESVLLRTFFADIARKIDSKLHTRSEELSSIANEYADVLSGVPYIGSLSGLVKTIAGKKSTVDIDDLKERFVKALHGASKHVVIMMDDIDRLDKAEIQTVFRLVKLLADFPNTTYILFFDDKRVAEALEDKYGKDGGGRNFLEKIIQVPLPLPPSSKQARRALAVEGIDAALALADVTLSNDDGRRLGDIFNKAFLSRITTPRIAKRFGNALTFALPILAGEVDIIDLILIEAVRIFYPELYAAIRNNEDAFLGTVFDPLSLMNESDAKTYVARAIQSALEVYSADDRRAAGITIQALFPRTGASGLFKAGTYSSDFNERWANEKRIGAKEYFPRYFYYGVPEDDISDQDIERFLAKIPGEGVDKLSEEFKTLSSNNREHVLIEKLRQKEDNMPPEKAAILALVVALSGNHLPYSHPTDRFFGLGTYSQASALIRHLFHQIEDQNARESLAIEIAERIEPFPFAYDYSSWMRKMKRSSYSDEMVSVISEECETEIRKRIVRRLASFAEREPVEREYPQDAQQLYRLWASVDKETLRDYLKRRIAANPSGIAEFISAANGFNPSSESSQDWSEDVGWFDFICDLIPPSKSLGVLKEAYPKLDSAEYNFLESKPMNNKERAARWFQRLYREKFANTVSVESELETVDEEALSTSDTPLELILEPKLNLNTDERQEYQIDFSVKNTRTTPISDYRVEVEFPVAFLQEGWHPTWEETERRTETHRFFRMTKPFFDGGESKWILYGGDTRLLFSVNFHVDKKNYRAEFLQQSVWSIVYFGDTPVRRLERKMSDLVKDR
jgi:hypothetical protein